MIKKLYANFTIFLTSQSQFLYSSFKYHLEKRMLQKLSYGQQRTGNREQVIGSRQQKFKANIYHAWYNLHNQ